jgi:flavin-dependent dehydrogenase
MANHSDNHSDTDIVIIGGGLAGLCMARQLHRENPNYKISIIEGQKHPLPDAGVKVGESTIEIAAHYFRDVLGLGDHIRDSQLPKFALRFYFSGGVDYKIEDRMELGVSEFPPAPTYQIDRGIFESFLSSEVAKQTGSDFIDDARVISVGLTTETKAKHHKITYRREGVERTLNCRWVVDTSGRAGVLKNKMGLAKPAEHNANAVWLRVEGKVDVRELSNDPKWRDRIGGENRWLSTNHLMGEGYWVWVIPLPNDVTSIGIVADENVHPFKTIGTLDRAKDWLQSYEPQFAELMKPFWNDLIDFRKLRNFSHDATRVFSKDRWAISGVAGVFLDPFYSPGSDYIAFANTMIAEMIKRDFEGQKIDAISKAYEGLYFSFFENNLKAYTNQYPIFGNGRVMPIKIAWDYGLYWSVFAFLFVNGAITDERVLVRIRKELSTMVVLNTHMQGLFRQWGRLQSDQALGNYVAQYDVDWLLKLNQALTHQTDAAEIVPTVKSNMTRLIRAAAETTALARTQFSELPELSPKVLKDAEISDGHPLLMSLYQALGYIAETPCFLAADSTTPMRRDQPNNRDTVVDSNLSGSAQSDLAASLTSSAN